MKSLALTFASVAAAFAAFSCSGTAHALGPIDLEIAARGGYATNPSSTDFGTNPYGGGFGGRAGVSFFGIYGGVSGMYYLGGSQSVAGVTVSSHTTMEGVEVGFTLPIPLLKIRPEVGVGNATMSASGSSSAVGGASIGGGSSSNLYVEPGVLVMIPLGTFFVGADVNALILPNVVAGYNADGSSSTKAYTSLSVHAQLGVKF